MATILGGTITQQPPEARPRTADSGGGGWQSPGNSRMRSVKDYSPPPVSSAVWVLIAAIIMTFAAFSSALIVRQGASMDWRHLVLPRILYGNTLVLILSSISLAIARRRFAFTINSKERDLGETRTWLGVTLILGLLFVVGQWAAWMQLRSEGLYLATNPNSSFFYVLTVAHAGHVIGGIFGLAYVIRKLNRAKLRKSTLDAVSIYWHFVDVLWVYLLVLLFVKI